MIFFNKSAISTRQKTMACTRPLDVQTKSGDSRVTPLIATPKLVPVNINNMVNNIPNKQLEKAFALIMNKKKNHADNNNYKK